MRLDQIYSTFANTMSRECFDAVYNKAAKDPHGFLYIDVERIQWFSVGPRYRNKESENECIEKEYGNNSNEENDPQLCQKKTQVQKQHALSNTKENTRIPMVTVKYKSENVTEKRMPIILNWSLKYNTFEYFGLRKCKHDFLEFSY